MHQDSFRTWESLRMLTQKRARNLSSAGRQSVKLYVLATLAS